MIEAQHLTKRYGKTVAVDEASFAVLVNGKPYRELADPLRSVGALLDAKAIIGGLDPDGILWIRNLMKSLAAQGRNINDRQERELS